MLPIFSSSWEAKCLSGSPKPIFSSSTVTCHFSFLRPLYINLLKLPITISNSGVMTLKFVLWWNSPTSFLTRIMVIIIRGGHEQMEAVWIWYKYLLTGCSKCKHFGYGTNQCCKEGPTEVPLMVSPSPRRWCSNSRSLRSSSGRKLRRWAGKGQFNAPIPTYQRFGSKRLWTCARVSHVRRLRKRDLCWLDGGEEIHQKQSTQSAWGGSYQGFHGMEKHGQEQRWRWSWSVLRTTTYHGMELTMEPARTSTELFSLSLQVTPLHLEFGPRNKTISPYCFGDWGGDICFPSRHLDSGESEHQGIALSIGRRSVSVTFFQLQVLQTLPTSVFSATYSCLWKRSNS